jgi:hypothetical protein
MYLEENSIFIYKIYILGVAQEQPKLGQLVCKMAIVPITFLPILVPQYDLPVFQIIYRPHYCLRLHQVAFLTKPKVLCPRITQNTTRWKTIRSRVAIATIVVITY